MIGDAPRLRPRGAAMRPGGPRIGRASQRALAFAERILARMRRGSSAPGRLERVLLGLGRPGAAMRPPVNIRVSPIVQLHLHATSATADAASPRAAPPANPRRELVRLRRPSGAPPEAAATRPAAAAVTAASRLSRTLLTPPAPVQPRPRQPPPPLERVYARAAPSAAQTSAAAPTISVTGGWPAGPMIPPPGRPHAAVPSTTTTDVTLSRTEVGRVAEDVMGLLERRFLAARERFGGR